MPFEDGPFLRMAMFCSQVRQMPRGGLTLEDVSARVFVYDKPTSVNQAPPLNLVVDTPRSPSPLR